MRPAWGRWSRWDPGRSDQRETSLANVLFSPDAFPAGRRARARLPRTSETTRPRRCARVDPFGPTREVDAQHTDGVRGLGVPNAGRSPAVLLHPAADLVVVSRGTRLGSHRNLPSRGHGHLLRRGAGNPCSVTTGYHYQVRVRAADGNRTGGRFHARTTTTTPTHACARSPPGTGAGRRNRRSSAWH